MFITGVKKIIMKNLSAVFKQNALKIKRKITADENGVALITVLLITLILSLLAAVAIETTGTDMINAGQNYKSAYVLNTSNAMMNLVVDEIATNIGTDAGIGVPTSNYYYYTAANPPAGCSPGPYICMSDSFQQLTMANISAAASQNLGFQNNEGNAGFEYTGQYSNVPGYSSAYMFYKGVIYSIANKNINSTKTITTGMNFEYGPLKIGYQ
jgi:Tfp pilus assembly protein PilX